MRNNIEASLIGFIKNITALELKKKIQAGVALDILNDEGSNLLHLASEENSDADVFKLLLENGLDIESMNDDGNNPLMIAASYNNLIAVKSLLENGADINAQNNDGFLSMDTPAFINDNGRQSIHLSVGSNGYSKIKIYLKQKVQDFLNSRIIQKMSKAYVVLINTNYFAVALEYDSETMIAPMVSGKWKNNNTKNNLKVAKENGVPIGVNNALVRELFTYTEIGDVVPDKYWSIVAVTIAEAERPVYKNYNKSIHYAAIEGHLEVVKYLLENGANINAIGNLDYQSIHCAALEGHLEVVKYLLENGADINAKNSDGYQPIHCAVFEGHLEVVKYLLENGADINAKDNVGKTPLYHAVYDCNMECIKYLILQGADVNISTEDNISPLHIAIKKNTDLEIIQLLVEAGANINKKDNNRTRPIDLVNFIESPVVYNYLKSNFF